ncbi:hypothetical protein QQS21_007150 [Conoideocrella luteorostrata]|uniref:Uncharacterized protein n=1 Tax=Conoideocrella luteorostrata TaxID=1105319 RepID=A0AAJ0FXA2_9HYPO|nr:hypothetical protein QQS21_007150 [Conoideocrella luteorostrata]
MTCQAVFTFSRTHPSNTISRLLGRRYNHTPSVLRTAGCLTSLASSESKEKDPASKTLDRIGAALCVLAETLMLTPSAPIGYVIHFERFIVGLLRSHDDYDFSQPSQEFLKQVKANRDQQWQTEEHLFANFSLKESGATLGSALSVHTLAFLSGGAQTIGIPAELPRYNRLRKRTKISSYFDEARMFEDQLPDRDLLPSTNELIEKVRIPEGLQGLDNELAAENIDENTSISSQSDDDSDTDVQDEIVVNTFQHESQENSTPSECDDSDEGYRTESEVSQQAVFATSPAYPEGMEEDLCDRFRDFQLEPGIQLC